MPLVTSKAFFSLLQTLFEAGGDVFEENQIKRVFQSHFALFLVQRADLCKQQIRDKSQQITESETLKPVTPTVKFGGELRNQQRPTLERIDMKLSRFKE